jgi:hypothetical protein
MGEEIKVYKVLVGKSEEKRPLGRPRRRWEDGIRMDLREIGGSTFWGYVGINSMLSGSTVTTAWRVLGLRTEETASRYGG